MSAPSIHATNLNLYDLIAMEIAYNGPHCSLNHIDVSHVTDMSWLFHGINSTFNGDMSQWDTSRVTVMNGMFFESVFTGDISQWDVSNVHDMSHMFRTSYFNGDISSWNVSRVEYALSMFERSLFNQNISDWRLRPSITNALMFEDSSFTGDLTSWRLSPVRLESLFGHSFKDYIRARSLIEQHQLLTNSFISEPSKVQRHVL